MKLKKSIGGKKGQSLVETALILPVVVLILMGIIDFGLLFNNYLVINNASREAARSAAIGDTDVNIKSSIASMTSMLDQTKITITIYPEESLRKKGEEVKVTIEYNNSLITPVIGDIVPNPIHLKAETTMRVE